MKYLLHTSFNLHAPYDGRSYLLTNRSHIKFNWFEDGITRVEGERIDYHITMEQDRKIMASFNDSKGTNYDYLRIYKKLYPNEI